MARRTPDNPLIVGDWGLPLPSALSWLARPSARHDNDRSTARDFNGADLASQLPVGLSLRWLGTAGFELVFEGHHLLIDPFLTRPGLARYLRGAHTPPSLALLKQHIPAADTVLVGHTHFDHAMDVAAIAGYSGARVLGSPSMAHLMALHGASDQAQAVTTGKVYEAGPFTVTFVDSLHSKLVAGLRVPYEGEITCEHVEHLTPGAFRCGRVYGIHIDVAGVRLYHQGSANLDEAALLHRDIDIFLCGIAGRGFTPHYTERILRALQPTTVIAHHHDNFFLPVEGEMGFSLNVNLGGFVDEVAAVSRDFRFRVLDPLQRVQGER